MDSVEWMDYIIKIGGMFTAFSIVGNFLVKAYAKYVTEPDNRIAEKVQKENSEALKKSIEPLTKSIELLNMNLEDSRSDRKIIHARIDKHDIRIKNLEHNVFKGGEEHVELESEI